MANRTVFLILILAVTGVALAQSSSIRVISGVGYGTLGVEYEWGRGDTFAYNGGIGYFSSGSITGFTVVGGTHMYFQAGRQGPFAAFRFASGWLSDGLYSAMVALGTVTGGYRYAIENFELSGEVGFGVGNVSIGAYGATGASIALGLSVGYRF